MSEWLIVICASIYLILCGILSVAIAHIEPHYRWKVYYKPYMLAFSQTKYFRTRFGAKWYYRKWEKDCKWIYIHRRKEKKHDS